MLGEVLTVVALATTQGPLAGATVRPLPAGDSTPALVVVITVDQCRADYLNRWRSQLTGGLARLLRTGAVFTDAYQDHAMTETAPGHATVLSGRNPHSTGIVSNEEGVLDSTANGRLLGVAGPGASPWRFRGTELFDWIAAKYPDARALSVSRKDRAAILQIGKSRQQVYWYQRGQFTTSRYYAISLPDWIRAFNEDLTDALATLRVWDLLLPAKEYAEPDSAPNPYLGHDLTFPHLLPGSPNGAYPIVATPFMDSLTLALALAGMNRLQLGEGPSPDLLAISLSTTDAIGHAFGPDSREIHDQVLRLDRYLGQFLDSLYVLRDSQQVIVVLTADHGVTSYVRWSRAHGDTAAREVNVNSILGETEMTLVARAGPGTWMRWLGLGMLVMDRRRLEANHINVDNVVSDLAARIRAVPGVLRVDTPRSLAAADTARDAIARRWLNAIPPDLGVELVVTLRPHDVWGPILTAEHGQPSDDDTHVPLIIAGPGVRPGRYSGRVSVADLAPTLAHLIGVVPLEKVDGRVLSEALRQVATR
jgi:predicted AlkP superfamily pyrophosphatase or phosphodiesterase